MKRLLLLLALLVAPALACAQSTLTVLGAGSYVSGTPGTSTSANFIVLERFVTNQLPINDITVGGAFLMDGTYNIEMAVYGETSGAPGALIASSSQVSNPGGGCTINSCIRTFTFTSFNLAANTPYWIGVNGSAAYSISAVNLTNTTGSPVGPEACFAQTYGTWPSNLHGVSQCGGWPTWNNNIPWVGLAGYYPKFVGGLPEISPSNLVGSCGASNCILVTGTDLQESLPNVTVGHIFYPTAAPGVHVKMVVYDAGTTCIGIPAPGGPAIAVSNQLTGPVSGDNKFTFATPFSLTSSHCYYLGYFTDGANSVWYSPPYEPIGAIGGISNVYYGANTYGSGAPNATTFSWSTTQVYVTGMYLESGIQGNPVIRVQGRHSLDGDDFRIDHYLSPGRRREPIAMYALQGR